MKKKIILISLIFSLFLIIVQAGHESICSIQMTTTDKSFNRVSRDVSINISTQNSCSAGVFNQTGGTSDSNGLLDITLDDIILDYNRDYYVCTTIDGQTSSKITKVNCGQGLVGIEDINSTELNETIGDFGGRAGFNSTYNESYAGINNTLNLYGLLSGRFLNLSGTNANQNINISYYNFTSSYGFFDYVGIGLTSPLHNLGIVGDFLLTHTATTADEHGLELKIDAAGFGDVKGLNILYDTGAIATGKDEEVILINIDEFEATGGDVFGLEVLTTEGSANVYGLKVGATAGVIHHDSGTFGNMDSADNNGVNNLAEFISTASDVTIFDNDDDYVTIGDANKFEEIEFILDTGANINIKPTFEYSTGVGTWGTFTPTDGTNGFENTGVISWEDSDIPTWAAGTGSEYLIRITRTRNNLVTDPIEDKVQISAITEYFWDENADLKIHNLTGNNITLSEWLTTTNLNVTGTSYLKDFVFNGNADFGSGNITADYINNVSFGNITASGNDVIWEIILG